MNPIPASYLAARRLIYQDPFGAHPLVARVRRFLLYRADERRNDQRSGPIPVSLPDRCQKRFASASLSGPATGLNNNNAI